MLPDNNTRDKSEILKLRDVLPYSCRATYLEETVKAIRYMNLFANLNMLKCLFAKGNTWLVCKGFIKSVYELGSTQAGQFKGECLTSVQGLYNGKTD